MNKPVIKGYSRHGPLFGPRQKASALIQIRRNSLLVSGLILTLAGTADAWAQSGSAATFNAVADMPAIGKVDERFQSYNIEMVEVTGGRWWAPLNLHHLRPTTAPNNKATEGINPDDFQYRPPVDLANPKLRKLAAALSPAYVRVSDTWANTLYFQNSDRVQPALPPPGFGAVLTGPQWKGLIDFSAAVQAEIITSFSIGAGVRDANGSWTPVEAAKLLSFTKDAGGTIAAAEFFNEPNLIDLSGAPKGYNAADYGRDFKIFRAYAKHAAPNMKILGPGAVGEGESLHEMAPALTTEELLKAEGPGLDAVSYHFYGAVSQRCEALGPAFQTSPALALTKDWLNATSRPADFYGNLRDRYEPHQPLWLSETADAACGGNSWAADFIDSFRYLNQLGLLAKRGVQVVMHNTLNAGDYGLIDGNTLEPRPNYWAAVLWRRLMGTIVLQPAQVTQPDLYVYAHCMRGHPGGVTLLAINADRGATHTMIVPANAERFTLTAPDLMGHAVNLNGTRLALKSSGDLPVIGGAPVAAGAIVLPAASINFIAVPTAGNEACRQS